MKFSSPNLLKLLIAIFILFSVTIVYMVFNYKFNDRILKYWLGDISNYSKIYSEDKLIQINNIDIREARRVNSPVFQAYSNSLNELFFMGEHFIKIESGDFALRYFQSKKYLIVIIIYGQFNDKMSILIREEELDRLFL